MSDHNWEYRDWANERKCRSCGLLVRGYGSPAMPCTGPKAPGPKPAGDTGRHGLELYVFQPTITVSGMIADIFGGPTIPEPPKPTYARASWDIDPTETPAIRRAMLGARHG